MINWLLSTYYLSMVNQSQKGLMYDHKASRLIAGCDSDRAPHLSSRVLHQQLQSQVNVVYDDNDECFHKHKEELKNTCY